ncbi:MAG: patatin-like phospholipase family protein, partial [Trueperaceae bacterium]
MATSSEEPSVGAARGPRSVTAIAHRPFAVVLAGGGARGLGHAGVLRALEHEGLAPAAIVGVSMGAIVGATHVLNPDWYRALLAADVGAIPGMTRETGAQRATRLRAILASGRALRHLLLRWGVLTPARPAIEALLETLTLGKRLEDARIPFAAVATDLASGARAVLTSGPAAEAVYASSALAGILPPVARDGALLADGCYADVAPIDVARALVGGGPVIAVNPSPGVPSPPPRNGLQAVLRAMDVSVQHHALVRFGQADLELRIRLPFPVATIDFSHQRTCVAAGVRAVRAQRTEITALLAPPARSSGTV